jgi:hypothetical protein
MTRQYNVETYRDKEVVWYEENGVRVSFMADPANTEYQRYLNPEAEQSTLGLVNSDKPAEPVV